MNNELNLKSLQQSLSPRLQYAADCILIILVSAIFYWLLMPHFAITSPDEARYAEVAREMAAAHHYLVPRLNGIIFIDKPPMFYWITAAFFHVFGTSVTVARSVPSICAIGISWGIYQIGSHIKQRLTGLLAALLFLASPIILLMGHFVNLDMMVACFITLSLTCFISSTNLIEDHNEKLKNPNRAWIYAAYTFVACAILTKGLIGIVIPAMAIGLWIILLKRWSIIKNMAIPSGLTWCFLLSAPWFIVMQSHFSDFSHFFFYTQQVGRYISKNLNDQNPTWFYPAIIAGAFLFWLPSLMKSIYEQIRNTLTTRKNVIEILMLTWAIGTTIFFSIPKSKTLGYILPALAPFAWLVANNLNNKKEQSKTRQWNGYYWLLLALAATITSVLYRKTIPENTTLGIIVVILWLVISGIIFISKIGKKNYATSLVGMILAVFIFNAWLAHTVVAHSSDAQRKSIAPLIARLKKITANTNNLIMFNEFYYDLPFTLNHKVTIVSTRKPKPVNIMDNWEGQLYEGLRIEPGNKWFIPWEKWKNNFLRSTTNKKPLYIITEAGDLAGLKSLNVAVIAKYQDTLLLRVSQ